MMVQFILGRSGTGKTSYCINSIVKAFVEGKEGQRLIFLVPEQATYQAERAILSSKEVSGYSSPYPSNLIGEKKKAGLNVLSFDRLQYLLLGKNTIHPRLSKIGQQMIIHRILAEQKDGLKLFGQSAAFAGFSRRMAETIAEIQRYAKEPQDIEQLVIELDKDKSSKLSALKFADVALILREYIKFVESRFLDPDMQLNLARRTVDKSRFFKGARVWVDGFAGFTNSELAMLAELLKAAAQVHIALCLDTEKINLSNPKAGQFSEVGLFNPTEKTYAELIEVIRGCKLKLAKPVILGKTVRSKNDSPLAHIERNIFESNSVKISAGDSIRIIAAPNMRAEIQFVARKILELVRQKRLRYRDIAVIAPDLSRYEHYLRAYFEDYNLPFFIDRRRGLRHHPVVTFISSAVRAAVGGFCTGDIFEYLKCGLAQIESYEVDLLENYCLAFGISSSDWASGDRWSFDDKKKPLFDEELINKIRHKAIDPLIGLSNKLYGADKRLKKVGPEHFTSIVIEFLDSIQLWQKIDSWIKQALAKKDYAIADEQRQFYDGLLDLFDELCRAFAGFELTCDDYMSILEDAFSQLSLALIPPKLDEIIVGSIERSRHPDLKAVFLIGATQKDFPLPITNTGLLSDEDRQIAQAVDFELGATTTRNLAQRQYLAYIAFTRPSEFLYISYPATDEKGRAVVRSQFIDDIESLFDDVTEERIVMHRWAADLETSAVGKIGLDRIYTKSELTDYLCLSAGKNVGINALVDYMSCDRQLADTAGFALRAVGYDNQSHLDKDIAERIFGSHLHSSATRLGTFAKCPYKYFTRYVLELKERKEFKFEPLDLGSFYHRVLDEVLRGLKDCGQNFHTVSIEQLKEIFEASVAKIIEADSFIKGLCRSSLHNTFIIASACEVLQDCVLAVSRMVRAGSFQPVFSELIFGKAQKGLGQFQLYLGDGRSICLSGRIDRIDLTEAAGGTAAVIFDYKRSGASFNWSKFYHGLDMQLVIYMLALRNSKRKEFKNCKVAGAFYLPIERYIKKGQLTELEEQKESFDYKARGLLNGDYAFVLDNQALKNSRFYNFYVTKDGKPYGNYSKMGALKTEDFDKVLRYAEGKIVRLAEGILAGCIDIKPYRLGTYTACSLCRFKSVCRFDWQINDYNFLESRTKMDVLGEV